jgi:hypothetical protein
MDIYILGLIHFIFFGYVRFQLSNIIFSKSFLIRFEGKGKVSKKSLPKLLSYLDYPVIELLLYV